MAQKFLSIKNFEKYQTYQKSNPPWIKLHKSILGDREFMNLPIPARYLYIGLIILATETNNRIYNDRTWIGQRLYIPHTEIDLKPLYRAGFLLTSNLSRALSETETETEAEAEAEAEAEDTSATTAKAVSRPISVETWESYSSAYNARYGKLPVRNHKVNSQLAALVKRLGSEEAPKIAAFYLTHNKPLYVSSRHCTDLLLRDAEGLHTEWATGIKATTGEARNVERRDDAIAQIERVRRAMQGGA